MGIESYWIGQLGTFVEKLYCWDKQEEEKYSKKIWKQILIHIWKEIGNKSMESNKKQIWIQIGNKEMESNWMGKLCSFVEKLYRKCSSVIAVSMEPTNVQIHPNF